MVVINPTISIIPLKCQRSKYTNEKTDCQRGWKKQNPNICCLQQGSPTPRLQTRTGLWPVRNQAAQQEVSGGQVSEAASAAPRHSHYHLNSHPPPTPVCGKIVFHETGPWYQKGWGPLVYKKLILLFFLTFYFILEYSWLTMLW